MTRIILTLIIGLSTGFLYAQSSCDSVKQENAYLKKVLSISSPIVEVKKGDLSFSITKVAGDIKNQSVTIEVLIKNSGKNLENFGSSVTCVYDSEGNKYALEGAYVSQQRIYGFMSEKLFRDTPLKVKYIFRGIEPETKIIKLLEYPVKYHVPGTSGTVKESLEFRDFSIEWQ